MNSRFIIFFALFLALNTLFLSLINYWVDPLQVYRKQTYLDPLFTQEQRFQVPGLISSYSEDANTAVIGDSMTSNIRHNQIRKYLGDDLLKLSIDGSTLYEQIYVTRSLLSKPYSNIRTVIWGLDILSFNAHFGQLSRPLNEYPLYLYDDKITSHLRYTLSADTLIHSFQTLAANVLPVKFFRRTQNIEQLNIWDRKTGCGIVFQQYKDVLPSKNWLHTIQNRYNGNQVEQHVGEIRKLALNNPEVSFELFYPPYSIVRYKYLQYIDRYKLIMLLRDYIGKNLIEMQNVHFHDLASDPSLISRLEYYKDMGHYSKQVNRSILMSIKNSQHVKSLEQLRKNTERLHQSVNNYDLTAEHQKCTDHATR